MKISHGIAERMLNIHVKKVVFLEAAQHRNFITSRGSPLDHVIPSLVDIRLVITVSAALLYRAAQVNIHMC